jgi:hypothetical protein
MKEFEIRPKKTFDEYLRLAKIDTKTYFINSTRVEINCPACENIGKFTFNKNNFDYSVCGKCYTLYVNPRPEASSFIDYYENSPSSKYWATTFYKETAENRRKKIWQPKSKNIKDILESEHALDYQIIDIGGGYGIFAEEMQKMIKQPVTIIEPAPHLASICRDKGFDVIEKFLENVLVNDLPVGPKCFVSFELFEHLHSPKYFLQTLNKLMSPDDLFIFTTLSGTGLDIQILWKNSPSVSPPHHLNFFNPNSMILILERTGFECIKVTTPGKLDIDIMINNQKYIKDRFWKTFLMNSNNEQKGMFQSFLSKNELSSHMMIISRKV